MVSLQRQIRFSDEAAMLLEAATAFCREQSPSARVRALIQEDTGFDRGVWTRIGEMGWCGLAVPEALGGSGLAPGHLWVLAEAMGRHLMATPFMASQLAVQALLAAPEALQAAWLPRLAQGEAATVALFEEDGAWALDRPAAEARPAGAGQVSLHGAKTLVPDAGEAALLLASVRHQGAPALAVVERAMIAPGAMRRETVIDETRRCHHWRLDGIQLPAASLITGAAAQEALARIRRTALLLAAAEACGVVAGVLAVLVDYLNTREAFGHKIGSYQALKHPAADILIALERSRSLVAHAATLMNEGAAPSAIDTALAMAKAEAGDAAMFAGDRAVQFHGGFGFTWDCDAQLYLRRALWLQPWFGDAPWHRRRLADAWWPGAAAA